ncbi:unnamed protein product [Lactuca virosa]|uniref:Uncharacterized protein n=1 Tax=Lactuca virosa TaxID=75947 RepID=A0AAU9MKY7_9ASTR|nr:unnamed protein product [Lactuca virosa]
MTEKNRGAATIECTPKAPQLMKHPLAIVALVPKEAAVFAAGAVAGAAAKIVTAPFHRIKLIMQVKYLGMQVRPPLRPTMRPVEEHHGGSITLSDKNDVVKALLDAGAPSNVVSSSNLLYKRIWVEIQPHNLYFHAILSNTAGKRIRCEDKFLYPYFITLFELKRIKNLFENLKRHVLL